VRPSRIPWQRTSTSACGSSAATRSRSRSTETGSRSSVFGSRQGLRSWESPIQELRRPADPAHCETASHRQRPPGPGPANDVRARPDFLFRLCSGGHRSTLADDTNQHAASFQLSDIALGTRITATSSSSTHAGGRGRLTLECQCRQQQTAATTSTATDHYRPA
jgi:hypothetical protein